MKETPLVSVVIPTYNSSGTLIRSIESVFKQTYRNFEIIVIDDGSTDDTKTVLAPYSNDKRIMYLYQDNAGCGVARNNGVAIAQGEFIAFLDADDYWHEEKLRFQMEIFEKHADVIVCYTESYIKEPLSDLVWETKRNIHQLPRSGILTRFFAFHNVVTLSSAIVRKSSFEKVGGFTNHYDLMMVADLDLWLKLAPTGKFYAIPTPLMFYQIHRGITQAQIRENHRQIRDTYRIRMASATGMVLFWYSVGWLRSSILYWLQSMKIINIIKKIGIKGVILELLRRMYLRVDFFCYPYLIYHLTHDTFSTTDQLCDFSYRKSLRLLIPGQVESEIRSFLDSARNIQPKNIVEIGTAHGGNLFLLTKIAQDGGKIISIDLPNGDYGGGYFSRKQKVYKKFVSGSQQMFLVRDDSHKPTTLDQVREILSEQMIDLLFIDADHSYEGVKADFEMYSPLVRPGGIVAFHDIANDPNPTYGVHKFWGEIKNKYHHQEIIDDQNRIGYGIGVVFL